MSTQSQLNLTKLDLRKQIVLDLTKRKGLEHQKAQVALVLDHSGSMSELYRNGTVQDTLERIVPIAMQFDDNSEFELFLFENSCYRHKNNVTVQNCANIVDREIDGKYPWGGTAYAPVIKQIMDFYIPSRKSSKAAGFLSKLFGATPKDETLKLSTPVYVIFITDGENSDHAATQEMIREASNYGIFFQFVGIGSERFSFLEKLDTLSGRFIDNAGFFKIKNLARISDDDLYDSLLSEFPSWLNLAKSKNLIG